MSVQNSNSGSCLFSTTVLVGRYLVVIFADYHYAMLLAEKPPERLPQVLGSYSSSIAGPVTSIHSFRHRCSFQQLFIEAAHQAA